MFSVARATRIDGDGVIERVLDTLRAIGPAAR